MLEDSCGNMEDNTTYVDGGLQYQPSHCVTFGKSHDALSTPVLTYQAKEVPPQRNVKIKKT